VDAKECIQIRECFVMIRESIYGGMGGVLLLVTVTVSLKSLRTVIESGDLTSCFLEGLYWTVHPHLYHSYNLFHLIV